MILTSEADALSIFVDEAGDPTLFGGGRGRSLVESPGCSRYFILGKLEVDNPSTPAHKLKVLQSELLADPYFAGGESFRPERKACLQAVDYFLWALQRFYEQRLHTYTGAELPREDRYLNLLWPQMAEIYDLDFGLERGTFFFNNRHPLTLENGFENARLKKKKP
ncbi:MAG: hypothetical protein PHG00_15940 [Methylococcales bacterium]|nr:hypothetical protein [Methylococcales bacterium]